MTRLCLPLPLHLPPSLLRLLNSRFGSLLLLGRDCFMYGLPCAFVDLPRKRREAVLRSWAASPRRQLRLAFRGLKGVCTAGARGNGGGRRARAVHGGGLYA